jgi:hypothetical protein
MKTVYLKINSGGNTQPHQCATGADYAIGQVPDGVSVGSVAIAANRTVIMAPYSDNPLPINYDELDHQRTGKWINVYWEQKHGRNRVAV